jgi:hypothetical protein
VASTPEISEYSDYALTFPDNTLKSQQESVAIPSTGILSIVIKRVIFMVSFA